MYKAVICDLDGTLLNSDHLISEYTKDIINSVKEKGIKIFIATGRHHKDAEAFRDMLELESFLITSNGAKIHSEESKELFSHNLSIELTEELIDYKVSNEIHRSIYADDDWYVEEELVDAKDFHKESGFMYKKVDFNRLKGIKATKLFYISDDEQELQKLEDDFIEIFGERVNVTLSSSNCLEVMEKGVSKGRAITEVLEGEGIQIAEAMAFGDGLNDYEMLSIVGKGLLMGNCNQRLEKALPNNEKIDTNDNNGVAKYLEKVFLR